MSLIWMVSKQFLNVVLFIKLIPKDVAFVIYYFGFPAKEECTWI